MIMQRVRTRSGEIRNLLYARVLSTFRAKRRLNPVLSTSLYITGLISFCVSTVFLYPDHLFEKYPEIFRWLSFYLKEYVCGIIGICFSLCKLFFVRRGLIQPCIACTTLALGAWSTMMFATILAGHIVLITGFSLALTVVNLWALRELVREHDAARNYNPYSHSLKPGTSTNRGSIRG